MGQNKLKSLEPVRCTKTPLVLVADDDEDSRLSATSVLQHAGFRVIEAEHGDETMVLAREQQPAVILMDISMPGMDGWTATERLKADPVTAHVLILIMTSHIFPGDRDIAEKSGCDGYLTKPIGPSQLLRAVNVAIGVQPLVGD